MRSCSAIDKATNFPEQTPAIICRVSAYRNTQWLYHCYDKTETVLFAYSTPEQVARSNRQTLRIRTQIFHGILF